VNVSSSATGSSFPLNRAVIAKGQTKQLVYYWFVQRGRKIANEYLSKLHLLRDAVFLNRTDGALVRLTTPIAQNETETDAEARLNGMVREVDPVLSRFLPSVRMVASVD
jgi:EpsI family protein